MDTLLIFEKMMAKVSRSEYGVPCAGHGGTHATRATLPRKCRMKPGRYTPSSLLATARFVPTKKRTQDANT